MSDAVVDPVVASSPLLAGERVTFTGVLASMTHRHAGELVEQHGGVPVQHVSQQTTLLVVGEEGWPLEADGQPSVKLIQAQAIQQKGLPLRILSESEWLAALGLESRRPHQLYTPATLSQLLGLSVHEIRRWERMGLIQPVRRVLRLPYFDYAEVVAARRLADLIASGASAEAVAASLSRLQQIIPGMERPLAQLQLLTEGSHVLYRDPVGLLEPATGQRVFQFDELVAPNTDAVAEPTDTVPFTAVPKETLSHPPDYWFREGCRLSEEGHFAAAIEAYRLALIARPHDADYHFHLADTLYRQGNLRGAIERYFVAVENDHEFLEAWTQLGCTLAESEDLDAARDAFRVALDLHPDFPDAHFHLAQLLERLGDSLSAQPHWRRYLTFDQRGPWAELARQRLNET
ncbi:MAG TPA: tetratricopeptide repeat protein [Planctomycetaceae bacterium]|nr:tetratricopeptide repeat protein [Planctomycetaceae bacterium]